MEEASKIFQVFRASGHSLHISTLEAALRFSDYREAIRTRTIRGGATVEMTKMIVMRWNRMMTRLNSRCKGLLETVGNDYEGGGEMDFPSGSAPPVESQTEPLFHGKISIDEQTILISDTQDTSNLEPKNTDGLHSLTSRAPESDPDPQTSLGKGRNLSRQLLSVILHLARMIPRLQLHPQR